MSLITQKMIDAGVGALGRKMCSTNKELVTMVFQAMFDAGAAEQPTQIPTEDLRALRLRCVELAGGVDLPSARAIEDFVLRPA